MLKKIPWSSVAAWALVLAATVVTYFAAVAYERHRSRQLGTIDVVTRSPLNGNFEPREITVNVGKPVRLRIKNAETVSHGFAIPELGVGVPEIKPGQVQIVEFTPTRAGTFAFACTVWCSNEHMAMKGKLVVTVGTLAGVHRSPTQP